MGSATDELTIKDYIHEVSPEHDADSGLQLRMCELLNTSLDNGTCEGGVESFDPCDIDTSLTYGRHSLDWAYQQAQSATGAG